MAIDSERLIHLATYSDLMTDLKMAKAIDSAKETTRGTKKDLKMVK